MVIDGQGVFRVYAEVKQLWNEVISMDGSEVGQTRAHYLVLDTRLYFSSVLDTEKRTAGAVEFESVWTSGQGGLCLLSGL